MTPAAPSWGELKEGMKAAVEFAVTAEDMEQFARLSGDRNPLHTDDTFARAQGFDGRVVYGALLAAKVSQLIGMQLPGLSGVWLSLHLEFRKPLYIGQPAEAEGAIAALSESTKMITLKIVIHSSGKILTKGEAEVLYVQR